MLASCLSSMAGEVGAYFVVKTDLWNFQEVMLLE